MNAKSPKNQEKMPKKKRKKKIRSLSQPKRKEARKMEKSVPQKGEMQEAKPCHALAQRRIAKKGWGRKYSEQ